jgi:hypothetical protein
MKPQALLEFQATIDIIGINPFVAVPGKILEQIFLQAGKRSGPIPIKGVLNGKPYIQTLVRYQGDWRLYINTKMLPHSPKRIGERVTLTLQFDPKPRAVIPPRAFLAALARNKNAQQVYDGLSPSRQNEIVRYLAALKSEAALEKNIARAIEFLCGRGSFAGRATPQ